MTAEVLTSSYVGSRGYEYDLKLGHHVVQVLSDHRGLSGEVTISSFETRPLYLKTDVLTPSRHVVAVTT